MWFAYRISSRLLLPSRSPQFDQLVKNPLLLAPTRLDKHPVYANLLVLLNVAFDRHRSEDAFAGSALVYDVTVARMPFDNANANRSAC